MPHGPRLDAPGVLHHVIARGIERRRIFRDDADRTDFLARLAELAVETETPIYAWTLVPNHFHLLLRSGAAPISTVMRRALSGYVRSFNRRHRRSGSRHARTHPDGGVALRPRGSRTPRQQSPTGRRRRPHGRQLPGHAAPWPRAVGSGRLPRRVSFQCRPGIPAAQQLGIESNDALRHLLG